MDLERKEYFWKRNWQMNYIDNENKLYISDNPFAIQPFRNFRTK